MKGEVVKGMEKNKKLKLAIIILVVLLVISIAALAGTLLYNYFTRSGPASVEVPGNIITPDSETNDPSKATEPSNPDPSAAETTESPLDSDTKAIAISLYNKQPEDNEPFQVPNMFPGDSETKFFRIKVFYSESVVVRYHADIRPGYEKLAEVLKVKVRLLGSDETLYDGLMRDMPQSLNHALYTNTKTQSELYYEITAYLDTSVGNEYQDKDLIADFRWWVEETDHLDSPQTGDTTNIGLWSCLAAGSLLLLLILFVVRRKETADEQKN